MNVLAAGGAGINFQPSCKGSDSNPEGETLFMSTQVNDRLEKLAVHETLVSPGSNPVQRPFSEPDAPRLR